MQRWEVTGLQLGKCSNNACYSYCTVGEVAVTEGDPAYRVVVPPAPKD